MSYHNGSIWPHDNALIALGMAALRAQGPCACALFEALFAAASYMELRRLPELFCGFIAPARQGADLVSGGLLAAGLGQCRARRPAAGRRGVELRSRLVRRPVPPPRLPEFLDEVVIRGLAVGTNRRDILLRRYGSDVSVNVLAGSGECENLGDPVGNADPRRPRLLCRSAPAC